MRSWVLPIIIFIFGCLSVLLLHSIDQPSAPRQLLFFVLGISVFFIASRFSFSKLSHWSFIGYILICALLLLTLILGTTTRGSTRWIFITEGLVFQPSQLAVPLVGLYIANFIKDKKLSYWKNLLIFLGIIVVPASLILVEPDLGTTIIFLLTLGSLLFLIPITLRQWITLAIMSCLIFLFSWFFLLQPYQKARLYSFADTSQTQAGSYNARQALIAVGSGKLFGRGLGYGVQSHLRFLPERQTDFIYASLAEEFGFFGSIGVILLYLFLISFLIYTALQPQNLAGQVYLIFTATLIFLQMLINVGMNIGILPITGITLPLLSYGGSSVLSLCGMLGIAQSAILAQKKQTTLHIT